jgi:hypothetical protein
MTDEFNTPIQPPIEPLPIEQPKKSNKTVWIIVIVVVVLLCCCCVLGAVFGVPPLLDWLQTNGMVQY